jgi:hypothetical protein
MRICRQSRSASHPLTDLMRGSRFKAASSVLTVTMQRIFNDGISSVNRCHFLHLNDLAF